MEFQYYMPTKVITGKNCIVENKEIFAAFGKKAMIVTGRHSAKHNGSQKDVITALESQGVDYIIYDQVMSNPTVPCVYEGARIAKEEGVDFIIAIGGGSPMDAGKAIALLSAQEIPQEDFFSGNYKTIALPTVMIPTTAGTGSEVTPYAIFMNEKGQTKTSIASPILFPKVSFLDARYMKDLSKEITVNTALDALSHGIEGMLAKRGTIISEMIAKESIRIITTCFADMKKDVILDEIREQLLYASMLAGIVIAHTGTISVHSMGYALTYFKDIDHGRANGLLLGEFMDFVKQQLPNRIQTIINATCFLTLEEFRVELEELLGEKESITADECIKFTEISSKAKNNKNSLVEVTSKDILLIYQKSVTE